MDKYHAKLTALTLALENIKTLTDPDTSRLSAMERSRVYETLNIALRELNMDRRLTSLRQIEAELRTGVKES